MPHLFDVPGWSIPSPPTAQHPSANFKKRKRPTSEPIKLLSAEINLEKLVEKLKDSKTGRESILKETKKFPKEGTRAKAISLPKRLKPIHKAIKKESIKENPALDLFVSRPSKRPKTKHLTVDEHLPQKQASVSRSEGSAHAHPRKADSGLTALQQNMRQSLDGARFRMINESLYKSTSQEARQLMRGEPHVYEEYHTGFRHQVQSWPTNPIQHYISILQGFPPRTVIADLGCGDAALAHALVPRGMTVLSFDLVSDGAFITEADICDRIPLPGSEGNESDLSNGEGHVVDVVICSLSLMSTNWPHCLREAWRILKPKGELMIAEVASRFANVSEFQSLVSSIGFRLKSKDDDNSHFTLFEFQKVPRKSKSEKEWLKINGKGSILKPCEYKRR